MMLNYSSPASAIIADINILRRVYRRDISTNGENTPHIHWRRVRSVVLFPVSSSISRVFGMYSKSENSSIRPHISDNGAIPVANDGARFRAQLSIIDEFVILGSWLRDLPIAYAIRLNRTPPTRLHAQHLSGRLHSDYPNWRKSPLSPF